MLRWLLISTFVLAAGCGTGIGGTASSAQTICSNGGFDDAAINDSFDNVREGLDSGFTAAEMRAITAQACSDSCGTDDACDVACLDCHFAIVDEVF